MSFSRSPPIKKKKETRRIEEKGPIHDFKDSQKKRCETIKQRQNMKGYMDTL